MTSKLTIGKLATAANVGVDTVRYYERIGLMPSPARSMGGYRLYGHGTLAGCPIIEAVVNSDSALAAIKTAGATPAQAGQAKLEPARAGSRTPKENKP